MNRKWLRQQFWQISMLWHKTVFGAPRFEGQLITSSVPRSVAFPPTTLSLRTKSVNVFTVTKKGHVIGLSDFEKINKKSPQKWKCGFSQVFGSSIGSSCWFSIWETGSCLCSVYLCRLCFLNWRTCHPCHMSFECHPREGDWMSKRRHQSSQVFCFGNFHWGS